MRCKAKAKSTGKRCKRAAVPGAAVCKLHGGGAPQVIASARQRLLAAADPAAERLVKLLESEDARVVARAAQLILDRSGHGPVSKVELEALDQEGAAILHNIFLDILGAFGIGIETAKPVILSRLQAEKEGKPWKPPPLPKPGPPEPGPASDPSTNGAPIEIEI